MGWHILVVVVPKEVEYPDTPFLWITGQDNDGDPIPKVTSQDMIIVGDFAVQTKTVGAALFQVPNQPVTFPNDPCDADTKNGTCYTAEECSQKGGTNSGSCASGYGVCCTFALNCGQQSSENNTYFESKGTESGSCTLKICPCNDNICQLRLDFETFSLTGPSSETTAVCDGIFGQCKYNTDAETFTTASQCATDLFSITNPGGSSPPAICGTNTNEHMYVDSNSACNDMNLILGTSAVGTSLATRSWSVRVTQIECTSNLLAPAGCTQYFYGDDSGTVKTYNYAGGYHLANQNQVQCIRREKGNCKICYAAVAETDFSVSGAAAKNFATADCCSYGEDGAGFGYDCVIIDGLSASTGKPLAFQNFCGNGGLLTAAGAVAAAANQKTLCTKQQPFKLQFQSDNWESKAKETDVAHPQIGYNLAYTMSSSC